jgi:flagellar basal-body rod modification protein FlgD
MAISGITSTPGASATAASSTDSKGLAANYEMFLTLLTTQLRNQSPLDPMDANQFTQQLVQYSSIEQQIKMNSNLEEMKSALSIANATSLVSYVGTTVTADSSETTLQNGAARWSFVMPKAAEDAVIKVKNASGEVVYQTTQDLLSGTRDFVWNGKTGSNTAAPDGRYKIEIEAKDASGNAVKPTSELTGTVQALDFSSGQPYLVIDGVSVSVWSVKSVKSSS